MIKNEKGVTIIALVVTIIVLIIIAGISIGPIKSNKRDYKGSRRSK